ncbi:MAG: hypothetical protein F4011_04670 [Acidimicrobiaceae bacterium]|nr:hypothetical protein [Acidimicrobiaceae bacterium]MYH00249.1 hypothetical protein [Acidimicrobiaceae bacterium]MYL03458.1 hypothetical protein [Acidimicrobiaceae bacterium]
MDIAATLRRYDGKRIDPFRSVAEAVRDAPENALGELLDLAASDEMELQIGATWVLKHLAERGTAPSGPHGEKLLRLLGRPLEPDALLHILQTLPHMEVDAEPQGALRDALLALIKHRRAFVRAWAYNGLGVLAAREPSLRQEIQTLFDRAARTETAAVKARIRHARAAWDNSAHG